LRLRPRDFWALSLPEWRAMLNPKGAAPAMARAGLEQLMREYPDAPQQQ
jgi:uncharacterized phage protein (TIGR02216 family)